MILDPLEKNIIILKVWKFAEIFMNLSKNLEIERFEKLLKGEKAGNEKKKKVEQIEKFRNITSVLKSKCFCKRDVATLKQIKGYLKKEKKLDDNILNQINDANVIEK